MQEATQINSPFYFFYFAGFSLLLFVSFYLMGLSLDFTSSQVSLYFGPES
jgi:hypothetical protein